ncbi:MAG: hypothetical protein RXR06_11280 [Thermoproteus sp.]
MRVVWIELLKEEIIRELYKRVGLLLRGALDSPVFFLHPSSAEYVSPSVELFIPYGEKPMILYSSAISRGRPTKHIFIEDGGYLKGYSFIRRWADEGFQNKIYVEILKPDVGLERRLLEDICELSNEPYGWINIGLVSEVDESRKRDILDRSLILPIYPLQLLV